MLILFFLLFICGCIQVSEEDQLDEFQVTACEEAGKSGTCQTRLVEVGIVSPDECCKFLGVCC